MPKNKVFGQAEARGVERYTPVYPDIPEKAAQPAHLENNSRIPPAIGTAASPIP